MKVEDEDMAIYLLERAKNYFNSIRQDYTAGEAIRTDDRLSDIQDVIDFLTST